MPDDAEALKILRLDLTPQSMRKWRDVNDGNPVAYPVLLKLSRELDPFEQYAMEVYEGHTLIVAEHDHAVLLIGETTLETVREQIPGLTARINQVVKVAKQLRTVANEEDSRLFDLLKEINDELSEQGS